MSRAAASVVAFTLIGVGAWARADGKRPNFRADDPVSELGVARIADENGDATLRVALGGELGRAAQLLAVRASPYAYAPETLWGALVELACGRDPALAPEAAAALTASESRLAPSQLAEREVLVADLRALAPALACPTDTAAPRADIALAIARFRARVEGLLGALEAP